MNKRYLCSRHKENTPSVIVYDGHGWCFGCCQKIPLNELGIGSEEASRETSYVENLEETILYIKSLPVSHIRGHNLHYTSNGYYLLWPNATYYKFRSNVVDTPGGKYRGPSGHRKPPFIAAKNQNASLALVEGEFNALSLASLELPIDVISPGGAGDFYSSTGKIYLAEYANYSTVYVVVDADAAGAQAGIETKARLITLGCRDVKILLLDIDFNDKHTQQGQEALREYCRTLGLPTGVSND